MRVLIVKTSSLGDIIHTFPALSDATYAIPGIQFDWVVEESYAQIPAWHPAVDRVIPTATRRWRISWLKTWLQGDWKHFIRQLQQRRYDAVIDAQGLIKSALITRKALGTKYGLDRRSAREPSSSRFYDQAFFIEKEQHAIDRTRQLFAQSLGYDCTGYPLEYGLTMQAEPADGGPFIIFLHGSAWPSKQWPLQFWRSLAGLAGQAGAPVRLLAGTQEEQRTARQVTHNMPHVQILPMMNLAQLAPVLKAARGVIAVDTGLAHMATALDVPVVSLYGATSSRRTGVMGKAVQSFQASIHCSPCYQRKCSKLSATQVVPPCTQSWPAQEVWSALQQLMATSPNNTPA